MNALVEASDLVLRTMDIDDKAKGLRFNWTIAKAGAVSNIIPASATLNADVRYAKNEDFEAAMKTLETRAQKKKLPDAEVKVLVTRGRPAFNAGEGGRKLVDKAVAYYKEAGGELAVTERTGGPGGAAALRGPCDAYRPSANQARLHLGYRAGSQRGPPLPRGRT